MRADSQVLPTRSGLLRAGSLTAAGQVAANVLRLAANLALTRLLAPEAFGLMALASVLVVGIVMLSDFGLQQVIVRSPNGENQVFLDTVWTVQVLHGFGVAALVVACAGVLGVVQSSGWVPPGNTYARTELPWILAGLSLQVFLNGFVSTKFHLATRRLQVARVVGVEVGCQIVCLGVMVTWAYVQPSVVALIAGNLSIAVCRLLVGEFVTEGARNRPRLDRTALKEVHSFGAWIFASSGLTFVTANVDKLVLGAVLSPWEFGLYAIALTLVLALHDLVLQISHRVTLPALSSVHRQDPRRLGRLYYRLRLPIDAFCLVMAGLLAVSGDLLINLLYDNRYVDAGEYLRILALSLLGIRFAVLGDLFLALGRSSLLLYEKVSRLLLLLIGIVIGHQTFGIPGLVGAVALSFVAGPAVSVVIIQRRLGLLDVRRELMPLSFVVLGVAAGVVARALV